MKKPMVLFLVKSVLFVPDFNFGSVSIPTCCLFASTYDLYIVVPINDKDTQSTTIHLVRFHFSSFLSFGAYLLYLSRQGEVCSIRYGSFASFQAEGGLDTDIFHVLNHT